MLTPITLIFMTVSHHPCFCVLLYFVSPSGFIHHPFQSFCGYCVMQHFFGASGSLPRWGCLVPPGKTLIYFICSVTDFYFTPVESCSPDSKFYFCLLSHLEYVVRMKQNQFQESTQYFYLWYCDTYLEGWWPFDILCLMLM